MRNKTLLYFSVIAGIGIFLRAAGLGSQSIWIDEFMTAKFAARDSLFYIFWEIMARDMHPPTFYMLEHFMGKIFGFSEISLRFIPFVFGVINIFVFYKIVRAFFSEKVSLIAVYLFAISPYQIYYSQEARMYTLFLFTSLMILYYFLMSVKFNSFMYKPFTIWSIIGVYVHSYTVMLLIILNILIFLRYREEIRRNLWLESQIIIMIFILPLIPFFIKSAAGDQYSHNTNIWIAPLFTFKNYIFGITLDYSWWVIPGVISSAFFVFLAVATVRDKNKKFIDIMASIALLFILIPWLLSIMKKPIYSERTFILVSVILIILLAVGISYLSKQGRTAYLIIITLFFGVSLFNYYFREEYKKTDYKTQFKTVMKNYRDGDIIAHTDVNSYAAFEFYNRYMYKKNFENRYLAEKPEFKGSGLRLKMRDAWRNFKENVLQKGFNLDIYSGYDRNILPNKEAEELIGKKRRVWLVRDNEKGMKQIWLPHGHVWASNIKLGSIPKISSFKWAGGFEKEKYFHFYGSDITLLVRQ